MTTAPAVVNLRAVNLRDPDVVRIDRRSKWGNPYRIGPDGSRADVIAAYRRWVLDRPELLEDLGELEGKRLACWCAPQACHGDVLAELVAEREGVTPGTPTAGRHCPRCNSAYGMTTGRDLCANCSRDLMRDGRLVTAPGSGSDAGDPVDPVAEGWAYLLAPCDGCGRPTVLTPTCS